MIKLLILAYDFPPYVSVGGLRPYSWYKYLHLFDVYPIVVTRQWQNSFGSGLDYIAPGYSDTNDIEITSTATLIKTPFEPNLGNKILLKYGENKFKFLRKIIGSYYEFIQFLFFKGTKKNIFKAADEYLKNNEVDCIIATGDPFVLFKYAAKLSKKYDIPWLADYRDSWVQDKSVKNKFLESWNSFFERKFLSNVKKVVTVSTFIQKQLEKNIEGKEFEIIYNGFDPEIINTTRDIKQNSEILSIGFAGTICEWDPIESFLRSCNELIEKKKDFKLKLTFYGINKESELKEMLKNKYQYLEKHTLFQPKMENLNFAKSFAANNIFLLFNYYSILGTKIFDYMALRRKIILCYGNDEKSNELKKKYYILDEMDTESKTLQADMLAVTNSGVTINDAEHLKQILRDLFLELERKGSIECQSKDVDQYSRINQAERLAEIVKEICRY